MVFQSCEWSFDVVGDVDQSLCSCFFILGHSSFPIMSARRTQDHSIRRHKCNAQGQTSANTQDRQTRS